VAYGAVTNNIGRGGAARAKQDVNKATLKRIENARASKRHCSVAPHVFACIGARLGALSVCNDGRFTADGAAGV